mgnify:CR=1 FL=1|tara:strand:- start:921 stop:1238 length:318 start_codon:yes stop_codon:yes gene_type:complete
MKRNKYGNKKVIIDGLKFDSKAEGNRYLVLKDRLQRLEISNLEMQPMFPVHINGKRVCKYFADFKYTHQGQEIIEDVKGARTAIYRLKKKMVEAEHNIRITEIKA